MSTADCTAVFDWDKPIDLHTWVDWALESFTTAGMQPDVILRGVSPYESKAVSLEGIREAAESNARYSTDIQMFATRPGYKQLAFGWRMCATLNMTKGRTAILSCEAGILDPFKVISRMAQIFGPVYGIGFQRQFVKGPDLYAYGMAAGLGYSGTDRTEINRIGAWMRERMSQNRHKKGMFRDVYPVNLLTKLHLDQEVEQQPFGDWVNTTQERGQLVGIGKGQWIWRLPVGAIESVRSSLRSAGLIIAE